MTPGIERLLTIALGIAAVLVAQIIADATTKMLVFGIGTGLLMREAPSSTQRAETRARASLVPPALMFLAVVTAFTQSACGFGETPAADTLEALDHVCKARDQYKEESDAAAGMADVASNESAAPLPAATPAAPPDPEAAPADAGGAAGEGGREGGPAP